MPRNLTRAQIERYDRDGVVFPIPIMSAAETRQIRRQLEDTLSLYEDRAKRLDQSHCFFRWAYDLATHPVLLDVLEDLLGPELFLHTSRIFYKPPHDPAYVSWHQDGRHSKLDVRGTPTVWIALSDSTPENGCLRVIPGTHAAGKVPHRERPHDDNLVNHGQEVADDLDESLALDVVLRPGELSIHHVNVIHGSNPNRSDIPRIGFSMSYITPGTAAPDTSVVHARGTISEHGFELLRRRPSPDLEEGVRAHRQFQAKSIRRG
jgi:ectoine hydroxylase-related dioxygenase (phytanoyl-CoA dioxygenase family)